MGVGNERLLVIMGGYGDEGVGGQFIKTMLSQHSENSIWQYSIVGGSFTSVRPSSSGHTVNIRKVPSSALSGLSSYYYWYFKIKKLSICLDEINTIIKEQDIELVWVVLNNFYTIETSKKN